MGCNNSKTAEESGPTEYRYDVATNPAWECPASATRVVFFTSDPELTTIQLSALTGSDIDTSKITDVSMDESMSKVRKIGDAFLRGWDNVESLDLSSIENITDIGSDFCMSCRALQSVSLFMVKEMRFIPDNFLAYCDNLQVVTMEFEGVREIRGQFLIGARSLQVIDLSSLKNVGTIGDGFLEGCTAIHLIDLSPLSNVTQVGSFFLDGLVELAFLDLSPLANLKSVGARFLGSLNNIAKLDLTPLKDLDNVNGHEGPNEDPLKSSAMFLNVAEERKLSTITLPKDSALFNNSQFRQPLKALVTE